MRGAEYINATVQNLYKLGPARKTASKAVAVSVGDVDNQLSLKLLDTA